MIYLYYISSGYTVWYPKEDAFRIRIYLNRKPDIKDELQMEIIREKWGKLDLIVQIYQEPEMKADYKR